MKDVTNKSIGGAPFVVVTTNFVRRCSFFASPRWDDDDEISNDEEDDDDPSYVR